MIHHRHHSVMEALTNLALNAHTNEEKLAFLAQARSTSNNTLHFSNTHNQLEHFVLQFCDDLCRQYQPSFLPLSSLVLPVECLASLLTNCQALAQKSKSLPTTIRWAVCVACRIWKPMLFCLSTASESDTTQQSFKQWLWMIKHAITNQIPQSVYTVRFLEVVAMSLLRNDPDLQLQQQSRSSRRQTGSASQVKPMPQFESLRDCPHAHALLHSTQLAAEGMECVEAIITQLPSIQAINSLGLIARHRPDSRDRVLLALNAVLSSSTEQILKPNLFLLLKAVVPNENALENNAHKDQVIALLQRCPLGEEHVKRLLAPLEKRFLLAEQKREELKRKLELYPENQSNQYPTEGLPLLPVETLCKLLLDNISHLPEAPPGHRPKQQKLTLTQSGLPTALDRLMQQVKAVETGRGGVNLPAPIKACGAIHVSVDQALKLRESAFARVVVSANATRAGTSFASPFEGQIAVARLACDVMGKIDDVDALKRQLHAELKQNVRDADEVATITALHVEYCADPKVRYAKFLLELFTNLVETNQTSRLQRVITQVPKLTDEVLQLVLQRCEDAQLFLEYFAILQALIFARPSCRETCVWFLLKQHAVRRVALVLPRTDSRSAAVNLVANRLVNAMGKQWKERICDFAQETFLSLKPEDEIQEEQDVVAKVLLLVALCATEPFGLVPAFFQSYASLKQKFEGHEEQSKLVFDTINMECDKLWTKLSVDVPALHALQTFLQYTPEQSTDVLFRAVEIFCQKNPSQAMLGVLNLVHGGGGGDEMEEPIVSKDARFLVPIIGCLSKDEVLLALGRICSECDKPLVERAIANVVVERTMDFVDLFLCLARNDIETDNIHGLQQACDALMSKLDESSMRKIVTELIAMVDDEMPPSLLMNYVSKAAQLFPSAIRPMAVDMLQRAVDREIWSVGDSFLWLGFQQLCWQCIPNTFELMLTGMPDEVFLDFAQSSETRVKNFKEMLKRAATSLLADSSKAAGNDKPAFDINDGVRLYLDLPPKKKQ